MNKLLHILVVFISFVLTACTITQENVYPPMDLDVQSTLPGVWDWNDEDSCQKNTHTITFSETGDRLILTYQEPLSPDSETKRTVYEYDIIVARGNSITSMMEDEHRFTESGHPVTWTLTMFTPNSYRWRQTDWAPNSYTNPVVRCADEAPSMPIKS
jgi:hypothetical protein